MLYSKILYMSCYCAVGINAVIARQSKGNAQSSGALYFIYALVGSIHVINHHDTLLKALFTSIYTSIVLFFSLWYDVFWPDGKAIPAME